LTGRKEEGDVTMSEKQGSDVKRSRGNVQAFMDNLDRLRDLIEDSKQGLFGKRTFTNYEEVTNVLNDLTKSAPSAVNSAMALVSSADSITSEARTFATKVKSDAEASVAKQLAETKSNCDSAIEAANAQADSVRISAKAEAEDILSNAKFEAERIVSEAQQRASQLVSENTITLRAQEEAARITDEAKRRVTEGYAQAQRQLDGLIKENLTRIDRQYSEIEEFVNKELIAVQKMHTEYRKKVNYHEN
jgi:cell division septum initiation protein DivIVA